MKITGLNLSRAGVCALLASGFLLSQAQAEPQTVTGKVRGIIGGAAQIQKNGGEWTKLKQGETVRTGDVIKTEPTTKVDIFVNDSTIRINPGTTLSLDKVLVNDTGAEKVRETQINIKDGTVVGNVKKLSASSKYEIKIPNGVAGIRGTDFQVDVRPLGNNKYKILVTSIQGTVVGSAVNNMSKLVTAVINSGESWDPDEELVRKVDPELLARLRETIGRITSPDGQPITVDIEINYNDPDTGASPTEGASRTGQ